MRRIVLVLIGALFALPALAQRPAGPGNTTGSGESGAIENSPKARSDPARGQRSVRRRQVRGRRSAVWQALHRKVESVDFEDMPLESFVEWLEEQGPISVVVAWRALEVEGVDADTPVTLRFRNAGQAAAKADYRVFVHFEAPERSCESSQSRPGVEQAGPVPL